MSADMADPTGPRSMWEVLNSIGTGGLAFMLLALIRGWLRHDREVEALRQQLIEMTTDRDEWKRLYLRRQGVVEDAVDLAKSRRS